MSYQQTEYTEKYYFEVSGEQPVEQPYSATSTRIDPHSLRIILTNGVIDLVWIYGKKYGAKGKLGKINYSFPLPQEYAPGWVNEIITELGLKWPVVEDDEQ